MEKESVRNHIREALSEVVEAEKQRIRSEKKNLNQSIQQGIEKMSPLSTLIEALKEEAGNVEGLEISVADARHMALIKTRSSSQTGSYKISTSYDNEKYVLSRFETFSFNDSYAEYKTDYENIEELMEELISIVGQFIGARVENT